MRHLRFGLATATALGLLATACAPSISYRGFITDPTKTNSISVGVDNKSTVEDRLGTPTMVAPFNSSVWYYVSSTEEQVAWRLPRARERSIMVVKFDGDGLVSSVDNLDATAGHTVLMVKQTTPTRGRELSFWEQMFGNLGRLPGSTSEGPGSGRGN